MNMTAVTSGLGWGITRRGDKTMREILFRGKRTDNGEWVYGSYVFEPRRKGAFGQTISELDRERHYIVSKKNYEYWEVIPETVGQYTGLSDKSGTKIFEGDIVQYRPEYWSEPHWSVVEYCADKWNYPAFDIKDHDYEGNGLQFAHEEGIWLEAIGTIYGTPEL